MAEKISCLVCGHQGHLLAKHLRTEHNLSVEGYQGRFPNAPVMSEYAMKKKGVSAPKITPERALESVSTKERFKLEFGKGADFPVNGYTTPGEFTPKPDPAYVFPKRQTVDVFVGMQCGDRILITGPTGSGKSSLAKQIAARLNYNFISIGFDGGLTRDDLVGYHNYDGEKVTFQEGILPFAMALPGTIICLDEWDTISSELSFVLQTVLQKDNGTLQILERGGRGEEGLVPLHPDNIIIATANTIGLGDDTGLYTHGTSVQNYSQLNRFGITCVLGYLSIEQEAKILRRLYGENLKDSAVEVVTELAAVFREAYLSSEVSVPFSTRDVINWAEKYCYYGDYVTSAEVCFLNRMPEEDRAVFSRLIVRKM